MPRNPPYTRSGRVNVKTQLFWVLTKCPRLRSLTTYTDGGHNLHNNPLWPPWPAVNFEQPLPQLSELSISDDVEHWGAKQGWAKLEKVTLWNYRTLLSLHGCEQSLKTIHLLSVEKPYDGIEAEFCSRNTNITELKITIKGAQFPFSILKVCGPSLTTLTIHPYPGFWEDWRHIENISLNFLEAIKRLCPKLTSLSTNLRWPTDSVASFQSCRTH